MSPLKRRAGLSGVVLAGGQSTRMGQDKAFLKLGNQTLIARVLDRLSGLCDEWVISANDPEPYANLPARVVPDLIPGRGALSGIHAGLTAIRHPRAVVVACDMPFLDQPFLRYMADLASGYDVVVPRIGEYYEPLHAIYSTTCVEPIARLISLGPRRVIKLYDEVRVREVTEREVHQFDAELSFFNINTPEEWAEVQRIVDDRPDPSA